MKIIGKVQKNSQPKNWLSCLIYILHFYAFFSMLQNKVVAWSDEDDFMRSFSGENIACYDMFDPDQCVFMETAFKIIVRKFDEKTEMQKDSFEKENTKIQLQFNEMKSQIKSLKIQNDFLKQTYSNITDQVKGIKTHNLNIENKVIKLTHKHLLLENIFQTSKYLKLGKRMFYNRMVNSSNYENKIQEALAKLDYSTFLNSSSVIIYIKRFQI